MLQSFFKNVVLKYPIKVLLSVFLFVAFLGFHALKLEIDASADTLLLENDKDLQYSREINKRYGTSEFLLIAFKPKDDLLSTKSLQTIENLSQELLALPKVESITSILNVPLLQSPIQELTQLVNGVQTLQNTPDVNKTLVKNEFLTSPLYKGALVSHDFTTTAIVVNLKRNEAYFDLIKQKEALIEKRYQQTLSSQEEKQLQAIEKAYEKQKEQLRQEEHKNIEEVRAIMRQYQSSGELFLGGVNMIVDDIITFVKNDLVVYGTTLLFILIAVMWVIFRTIRWVLIPVLICFLSVICTTGILGLFGWEVTVISSNFVSLQLIITISIVLHLIVRYNELYSNDPEATQQELLLQTVLSKAKPTFFAVITTIAGFSSLVVSGIKPVINLGWMMSLGIAVSLILAFLVFPSVVVLLKKHQQKKSDKEHFFSMTKLCSNSVVHYGKSIIYTALGVFIISIIFSSKLIVENSFISYFKKDTEIYQGMEVIDQKLGGTTPLDIIIQFKSYENTTEEVEDDFMSEFEEEFAQSEDNPEYWFTPNKMQLILKVHDYLESVKEVGDVQSLGTLLKVGKTLNNDQHLDSIYLALLYNQLPNEYKELILSPYIDIKNNEARVTVRIIDSNEELRRNELLKKIEKDLQTLVSDEATIKLTGLMVLYNNMLQSLFESQISTLGLVLAVLFLMFLVLFRSFLVALIALIVNIVPISVVFGLMGALDIPLNIMTITIAAISIGIGVDDTIHYIHRFKEEFEQCGDYAEAMKKAHNSIGYAMYYTSLAIMLGFSILVVSNFIPTIYFGLLTVVVMFMVLLADLLLLPKLLMWFKPYKKNFPKI